MKKARVEWSVSLYHCNIGEKKGQLYPRVNLRGTLSVEDLLDEIIQDRSELRLETLRSAAYQLFSKAEEMIIEGFAVSTPLGTLTPSVNGMWNSDRLNPEARGENKATLNYTMSKDLKEAFANPLFRQTRTRESKPRISSVRIMAKGNAEGWAKPGDAILIKGSLLLMNGELPTRGLYLMEVETGKQAAFIPAADFLMNARSEICCRIPMDMPVGEYQLQVMSQCTTNPNPMKQVAVGEWSGRIRVKTDEGGQH